MKAEDLAAVEKQLAWLRWSDSDDATAMWTHLLSDRRRQDGPRTIAMAKGPLSNGDVYYVHPDICSVLIRAAAELPRDTVFRREHLPSVHAFVVLGRSVILDFPHPVDVSAFGWTRLADAAVFIPYEDGAYTGRPGDPIGFHPAGELLVLDDSALGERTVD